MQGSRQWRRGLLWHPTRVHHASVAYVPGQPGDLWTLPLRLSAPAPAPAASDLPPGALSPSIPFLPALGAPPKAGGCLSAFPKSLHMEICPSWKPRGFFVLFGFFFYLQPKNALLCFVSLFLWVVLSSQQWTQNTMPSAWVKQGPRGMTKHQKQNSLDFKISPLCVSCEILPRNPKAKQRKWKPTRLKVGGNGRTPGPSPMQPERSWPRKVGKFTQSENLCGLFQLESSVIQKGANF